MECMKLAIFFYFVKSSWWPLSRFIEKTTQIRYVPAISYQLMESSRYNFDFNLIFFLDSSEIWVETQMSLKSYNT